MFSCFTYAFIKRMSSKPCSFYLKAGSAMVSVLDKVHLINGNECK